MERSLEKEMMDLPGNPPELLNEDLSHLRTINRCLGGYRGVKKGLRSFVLTEKMARFSLLDVGTGSGDIPAAVVRWAKRRGIGATIVGLEPEPLTVKAAKRQTEAFPEISLVRGDGAAPPFPPASFDFILASQLLHHFSEPEIVALLRTWASLARKALFVSDLIRHPLAYHGIRLATRLATRNVMTRVDAPLSVRRAFTLDEWRDLFRRAGVSEFRIFPLFPFRFLAVFALEG